MRKGLTLAIRTPTLIQCPSDTAILTDEFPELIHNKKFDFSYCIQVITIEEINTVQFIFQCQVDNILPNLEKPILMPNFLVKFSLNEFHTKTSKEIFHKIAASIGFPIENPQMYINNNQIDFDTINSIDLYEELKKEKSDNLIKCHLTEKALKTIEKKISLIENLIQSETIYLERLNYLNNYFIHQIKKSKIFDESSEKINFFNDSLRKIFKYHTNFYLFGLKKIKIEYNGNVSKPFLRLGDSFSFNFDFVRQYGILIFLMSEIQKNDRIRNVDKSFFNHEKININELTAIPSQRLYNYESIIKEILEITPKSQIEFNFLCIVDSKMKKILTEIDSFCDKSKNYTELNNLMKRLNDPDKFLSPKNNQSLKIFYKVTFSINQQNENGFLYLLNYQILLTKKNEKEEKEKKETIIFYNKIKKQTFLIYPENKINSILFFFESSSHTKSQITVTFESSEKMEQFHRLFQHIRGNLLHVHKMNQIISEEILTKSPIQFLTHDHSATTLRSTIAVFCGGITENGKEKRTPIITFNSNGNQYSIYSDIDSLTPFSEMKMTKNFENKNLYCFGGLENHKVMTYKDKKWIELNSLSSFTRIKHSFVSFKNYLVVFGGLNEKKEPTNEIFLYDLNKQEWLNLFLDTKPQPRFDHSAVVYKNLMIVHGGEFNGEKLNDTWAFNFNEMKWKKIDIFIDNKKILARSGHVAVIVNEFMVVIGGEEFNKIDLHFALNIETKEIIKIKIKGNFIRGMNNFAASVVKKRNGEKQIFCFGGFNEDKSVIINMITKLTLPDEINKSGSFYMNNEINI